MSEPTASTEDNPFESPQERADSKRPQKPFPWSRILFAFQAVHTLSCILAGTADANPWLNSQPLIRWLGPVMMITLFTFYGQYLFPFVIGWMAKQEGRPSGSIALTVLLSIALAICAILGLSPLVM